MSEYANEKLLALEQLKAAVREYDENTPLKLVHETSSDPNDDVTSSENWQSRNGNDLKIWDDIIDKPEFADVATSGSYNDLSNKPVIPALEWENIENRPTKVSQFTNDSGYQTEEEVQELIDTHVGTVYHPKGSVPTVADLPDNANEGDVYNVEENGINYAWTGEEWDALSGTVDLSAYATKAELSAVATSGDYNDLSNKPRVPSIVSESNHHWIGFYTGEKIEFEEGQSDYAIQPYDSSGQPLTPITWDKINISDYYTKDETNTAIQDAVENAGFLKRVDLTEAEYAELAEKDHDTVYVVEPDPAPDPLRGSAYAVLDSEGTLTLFRSENEYAAGEGQTVTDIDGNTYTGEVFVGVENTGTTYTSAPWRTRAEYVLKVGIANGQTIKPAQTAYWFFLCGYVEEIDLIGLNTSNVTDMSYMFSGCGSLVSLAISDFDTSNVTNMSGMFYNCSSLTTLDLSSFDTSNVTDMSWMFYWCSSLPTLDVTNFDTSKVTNMAAMFNHCTSLTTLDVANFNTSNVTDMSWMFYRCTSLATIYTNGWYDSSRTVNSSEMFDGSPSLPGYDTNNVTWEKARIQPNGYFTDPATKPTN